jgi:hypothetical protein
MGFGGGVGGARPALAFTARLGDLLRVGLRGVQVVGDGLQDLRCMVAQRGCPPRVP